MNRRRREVEDEISTSDSYLITRGPVLMTEKKESAGIY